MSYHKTNVGSPIQMNQQHHGNKVQVGGIIMKNTTPNTLPTNPIIHTSSNYPNSQPMIGGIQPTKILQNSMSANQLPTSITTSHPPPQLTNQNGIMNPAGDAAISNQIKASSGDQEQELKQEQQNLSDYKLANTKEKTPMCLINELARYNKISHQYTLVDEQGPAHKKTFYVTLKLGDKGEEYSANGPSIKKAQHAAAAKALEATSYTHPPPKPAKSIMSRPGSQIMPTVELNALAMKRGEQTIYKPIDTRQPTYYPPPNYNFRGMYNQSPPVPSTEGLMSSPWCEHQRPMFKFLLKFFPFCRQVAQTGSAVLLTALVKYHYPRMPRVYYVSLKVGQREFVGEGTSRQEARHDAAAKALNILNKLPIPNDDGKTIEQKTVEVVEDDEMKSEISLVHEIALKRNLNVSFDVIRESGPPHMKNFVTRCTVGDQETEAEGNSKKISKKKAAELMLEKLKELPPLPPSALMKPKNKVVANKKKSKNIIKQPQRADPNYGVGINPISRLIQIQQAQQKKEPVYTLVAERGVPRRREFVIQVTVDDKTCDGVGHNKKLAKRHAAEKMLDLLGYTKPSPQPAKPAIKSPSTPEQSGDGEKKISYSGLMNEKKVTFMENSDESGGEMLNSKTGRQLVPGLLLLPDSKYTGASPIYTQGLPNSLPPGALKGGDPMVFSNCPPPVRPELQLRDIATRNNIDLKFDEFSGKAQSEFLSRASLMVNPPRIFHGSGPTVEAARDVAAMEAIKFMAELGKDISSNGPQIKKDSEELANSKSIGGTHPGRVAAM